MKSLSTLHLLKAEKSALPAFVAVGLRICSECQVSRIPQIDKRGAERREWVGKEGRVRSHECLNAGGVPFRYGLINQVAPSAVCQGCFDAVKGGHNWRYVMEALRRRWRKLGKGRDPGVCKDTSTDNPTAHVFNLPEDAACGFAANAGLSRMHL